MCCLNNSFCCLNNTTRIFTTLFYIHVFSQHLNNITRMTLPNRSLDKFLTLPLQLRLFYFIRFWLMKPSVTWDVEVRVIVEQERMELCHCLALAILSLKGESWVVNVDYWKSGHINNRCFGEMWFQGCCNLHRYSENLFYLIPMTWRHSHTNPKPQINPWFSHK